MTTRLALPQSRLARLALLVAVAILFVLLTGLIDGHKGVAPLRLLIQPKFPLANALPGLLLGGLLLLLSRRLLWSFGLAYLLQAVLYGVNALKVENLGTPLMPADFRMVGQLRKGGFHLLAGYLPHSPWPYLALLAGLAAIIALWHFEPPLFARRTRGKRLVGGAVLAVTLGSLLAGSSAWAGFYNGRTLWLEPWSAASTTIHSGLVSSLLMFHIQYGHAKRKADPAAVKQLLAQNEPALQQHMQMPATPASALPDIVVIQSESFFDPSTLRGYEHADLTPNLRRLQAEGTSGPLYVPTFGGGTIRTEFEVLTGLSLRYFEDMQFPYLQMNRKLVPSMVRALNARGYETVAIHGNDPAFWNRTTAFKALGFDRFVSRTQFPANAAMDGKYMADSAMTDEIMDQLKDSGPPQFLFAISIEAHGPYDVEPANTAERDAIRVPAGIEGKEKLELQDYIYHIQHADHELGRLAALLAKRSRPTLLLFYGDHLPALTNVYHTLGFVDGGNMLSEPGTWLLVDPAHPRKAVHEDIASWMLPGKLLDTAGIHDDAYFALTQLLVPQLARLTRAPGAPLSDESSGQQQVDTDMASVALLRMKGKLEKLLPVSAPGTPSNYAGQPAAMSTSAGTAH
ncbi:MULTISPECIES: LTA synthase family protein [Rhodanobacter]|uniref:Phosphoglycerol transferase MdoB n=2 Tax=Rhodanobacter TaxID=75309 RepID=A0A1I3YVA9_9GAMM|nr:LTA synthase family protein [Rhodanobacter glycinis]SFK35725.1 Phosphoglycerol transferase MdoB [Rhodanobacter glycinis]